MKWSLHWPSCGWRRRWAWGEMTPKSWRSLWLVWSLQASSRWIIFLKKSEEGRGAEKRVAKSIRLGGVNVLEHQQLEWAANGRAGYCESSWTKKGRVAPRWRPKFKAVKDLQEEKGLNIELLRLCRSGAEQHWGQIEVFKVGEEGGHLKWKPGCIVQVGSQWCNINSFIKLISRWSHRICFWQGPRMDRGHWGGRRNRVPRMLWEELRPEEKRREVEMRVSWPCQARQWWSVEGLLDGHEVKGIHQPLFCPR